MNNPLIIGIAGNKHCGKSTAASVIQKHNMFNLAFGDVLKEMCIDTLALDPNAVYDNEKKEALFEKPIVYNGFYVNEFIEALKQVTSLTEEQEAKVAELLSTKKFLSIRDVLQYVATNIVRKHIRDDFWIYIFNKQNGKKQRFVVSDVRFANEREYIRSRGGKLVLIKKPSIFRDGHESETSLGDESEYDYVIENNGSKERLEDFIEYLYICLEKNQRFNLYIAEIRHTLNSFRRLLKRSWFSVTSTLKSLFQKPKRSSLPESKK